MGLSQYSLLQPFDLEGVIQKNEKKCNSNGSLWSKVLEARAKRRCQLATKQRMSMKNMHVMRSRTSRRILMKRTARGGGSRRPSKGIERRVKTLKKLVPNTESSVGLDGLFRETADYILSLQMRVRVMQIMVKVLTNSDE
ncbi:transcription factor UPBEAT1 [Ziziphus jujuba]|nr:transcription factor UPBEAT1 [Ziziphus jujuba]